MLLLDFCNIHHELSSLNNIDLLLMRKKTIKEKASQTHFNPETRRIYNEKLQLINERIKQLEQPVI